MSNIQHGKHITIATYYGGQISGTKEEIETAIFVEDRKDILKAIIDQLPVITSGQTKKLNLEVCIDSKGRYRLTTRWVVS